MEENYFDIDGICTDLSKIVSKMNLDLNRLEIQIIQDQTIKNFILETKINLQEMQNEVLSMDAQIFNFELLMKHYTMCLINYFMFSTEKMVDFIGKTKEFKENWIDCRISVMNSIPL